MASAYRPFKVASTLTIIVVALAMGGVVAHAQNWPHGMPSDEFTLDREADHYATLSFYNADPPNSGSYPMTLTAGDLTVRLRMEFSQGPEVLTVIPPDGWRAIPESVSVIDGEIGVIELFRGEFLGM